MPETIQIAGIIEESIVDGPGMRLVVFGQGCPHACPGCHNPQTHSLEGGYPCNIQKIVDAVGANPLIQGVTFSGGEPFVQPGAFAELARRLAGAGVTDILVYSGYTFEELMQKSGEDEGAKELLERCRILIDGRYLQAERSLMLAFRGSANQRIIDLPASLKARSAVIAEL